MKESQSYILMIEEDPDDRLLTTEILNEIGINVNLVFLSSNDTLFNSLSSLNIPHIIIIDYNSSPANIITIIQKIKSNEQYKSVPVIVLGDSSHSKYVKECYAAGASSYIKKPVTIEETKQKINSFFSYWLNVVEV